MTLRALIHTERNQGFIYSLIMGTAIFVYVTGGAIINPTKRDWLMLGDSAQHYLGWEFFRNTPLWQWPIGANYPLGMELSSSIVFTDSIPIAAFIAKLLNASWLNKTLHCKIIFYNTNSTIWENHNE